MLHSTGWMIIGSIFFFALPILAQETISGNSDSNNTAPIEIEAEKLNADSQNRWAEFIGKVKATQGTTTIEADRLKIFFKSGEQNTSQQEAINQEAAIEKVVAEGSVRMHIQDSIAETPHAVYTADDKVLILSGKGSRIRQGQNHLSGTKITVYRADGRILVQGDHSERVEAIFFPTEQSGLE